MLEVKNLSITYEDKIALSNFSLNLLDGELLCIMGESGSGKTSLLNAIMGFVDFRGEIFFNGKKINESTINEFRTRVSYIPQELNLPVETVEEMVKLPFSFRVNHHVGYDKRKLMNYWEILGLEPELYDKRVTEISGGQRQRIMVSVAGLLAKPLMLVDEPTSALDFKSAANVIKFLRLLQAEENISIMSITHHEKFANACDRIVQLR